MNRNQFYIRYVVCVLVFLCAETGAANLRFRQFNTQAGFPTKDVNITRRGPDGFMWFGTYNGVIRYDGTDFVQFSHDVLDSTSIPNNNVSEIFIDSQDNLFFGGSGFFAKYNKELETFHEIKSELFNGTFINSVVEVPSGEFYIATYNGVSVYNPKTEMIVPLQIQVPVWDMFLHDSVICLGTQYNGMLFLSIKTNRIVKAVTHKTNPVFSEETSIVINFAQDSHGNLWFTGNRGGLYAYNFANDSLLKFDIYLNGTVTKENPHCIFIDPEDRIWIAFINNGIVIYTPDDRRWQHITQSNPSRLSITSNSIRDIFEDSDGTVWLSTHFGGVSYFNNKDKAINYYYKDPLKASSLTHSIVSSFVEDVLGNIWVATDGGGLFKTAGDGKFKHFNRIAGLNSDAITLLAKDADGDIWLSEWMGGVQELDPENMQFTRSFLYDSDANNNRASEVKGVFCDSENRIWMFSHFTPISIFDQETEVLYTSANPGSFPPALFELNYCVAAVEDRSGNIWIATGNGLCRYSDQYYVERYSNDPSDSTSFIANSVLDIFCDSENRVWITTPEGLELYQPSTNTFVHVTQKYGFPQLFYGLEQGNDDRIWFSSQSGIGYFNPETMAIRFFDRNVPISGDDYISRSKYRTQDGKILFGSTNGYIEINPDLLQPDTSKFTVAITGFQLFNQPVDYKMNQSILSKSLLKTDSITLHHQDYVVSFKFSALYFTSRQDISYAYRLIGFDPEWNYVGNEQKATYTNLPPGEYVFAVKAQNIEGMWSEEKTMHITVLPAWYNTWWFRLIYLSAFIVLALTIYYRRLNYQKKLNKKLSQLVRARTNELSLANADLANKNEELKTQNETIDEQRNQLDELNKTKDKFFSIIAHDLKNPMHTLLGFTELLEMRYESLPDEKKLQFIKAIGKSSKHLFALMINLLDWARSQTRSITILPETLSIHHLVSETSAPLLSKAESKKIQVTIDVSDELFGYADKNMTETILRNIFSNALKFTPQGGTITIRAEEKNDDIYVSVKDTGQGMPADVVENLFVLGNNRSTNGTDDEQGTGIGLILCKEFAEQNNGSIFAESQEGKGSTFTFTIPRYHV